MRGAALDAIADEVARARQRYGDVVRAIARLEALARELGEVQDDAA